MMINEEKNKKGLSAIMKGRAVYIALSACVLAAGVVSFTAARKKGFSVNTVPQTSAHIEITQKMPAREKPAGSEPVSEAPAAEKPTAAPVTEPPAAEPPATHPAEATSAPESAAVFDNAADPIESTTDVPKQIVYSLPLRGKLGKDFSMGVPVFSATMNDYRTHNGADFTAEAGSPVHPVAAGRVVSVKQDPLFGYTVAVDHGGGVVSYTSGLAAEGLINEGADVYEETALGEVGEVPVEAADGSHIHLEIRVNGLLQDPLAVMGYDGADD